MNDDGNSMEDTGSLTVVGVCSERAGWFGVYQLPLLRYHNRLIYQEAYWQNWNGPNNKH
jgi:hypothetical protein